MYHISLFRDHLVLTVGEHVERVVRSESLGVVFGMADLILPRAWENLLKQRYQQKIYMNYNYTST